MVKNHPGVPIASRKFHDLSGEKVYLDMAAIITVQTDGKRLALDIFQARCFAGKIGSILSDKGFMPPTPQETGQTDQATVCDDSLRCLYIVDNGPGGF